MVNLNHLTTDQCIRTSNEHPEQAALSTARDP